MSEHAYDKLWALDCTFGEFEVALEQAIVIEESLLAQSTPKELLLTVEWTHPSTWLWSSTRSVRRSG
ncbi:MAG: hypothetical protein HKO63_06735 [Acidimicrobiia bacterium]|nr:hypothetical protein [Acidimicrobiia bacterium]MBT8194623.1 hypothetical protein [Acidimicrobiia bacterium]NNF89446.1 hypothetical protein [Acidimicrobiia bacterium]NNL97883.1 hypothetical protein [Acidimicrobiia bacterium]